MDESRPTHPVGLVVAVALTTPTLACCLGGPEPPCTWGWVNFALNATPGDFLLTVDAGANATLIEALNESNFTLQLGFPDKGRPTIYRLAFNATGPNGTGLYAPDPNPWYGDQPLFNAPPGAHSFVIQLEVDSKDPAVAQWVFFGGDNAVEALYTLSDGRRSFSVTSEDFEVPEPYRGYFTAVEDLRLWLHPSEECPHGDA